ncbi:MAG: hypothetical protein ACRELF_12990, partial [Gemmataceae bacterium]
MNCTVLQRRLLSAEQPEQPADEIKNHLAQCPACRAWQRRLVQMERQIPLLPIPLSTAKEVFLQRLTGTYGGEAAHPTIADPATLWRSTMTPGRKERAFRKVSLAFALAASLLVFSLAWWSWPHDHHPAPDIAKRRHNHVPAADIAKKEQAWLEERLSKSLHADTPKERVLRLTQLAEEVHGEAGKLQDNREGLEQRARFYSRVVGEHLIEQARQLPPTDRPAVLQEVAKSLKEAESEASRREAELRTTA